MDIKLKQDIINKRIIQIDSMIIKIEQALIKYNHEDKDKKIKLKIDNLIEEKQAYIKLLSEL